MKQIINNLKQTFEISLDDKIKNYCEIENIDVLDKIKEIVTVLIKKENILVPKVYVSIESASRQKIKKINFEYRNIDKPTDVLSFPIFTKKELENINELSIKEIELGDIIICLDIVKEQAKEYETGFLRELLYMITHGMCHLLGYDHEKPKDKEIMRNIEEEVLGLIGVVK